MMTDPVNAAAGKNQGNMVRDAKAVRLAEFKESHTELLTPELSPES